MINQVGDNRRILIVEDEPLVAEVIEHCLRQGGYAVQAVVASGEEAIKAVGQARPDLVLMDIRIRGALDGIETALHLKQNFGVPVVYLTAHADEATLDRALQAEPFGYLVKPLQLKEVRTTIEMALYKAAMERRLRESEQQQRLTRERLHATLSCIAEAVIAFDAGGRVEFVNPMAERLTGHTRANAIGKPATDILRLVDDTNRQPISIALASATSGGFLPSNAVLLSQDGTEYAVEGSITPISGIDTAGAVVVFRDVSQRRALFARFEHQARHDPLTGLANRREFERIAESAWTGARDRKQEHALLYLDLDRFKAVNDSSGHEAGDALLRHVSQVMKQKLRQSDLLARLGGDEFAVLLLDCPLAKAKELAQQIIDTISALRFAWQDKVFAVGASAGVAVLSAASGSQRESLALADAACRNAKQQGRGRVGTTGSLASEGLQEILVSADGLDAAMASNRFVLHGQRALPIGSRGDATELVEVLLRLSADDGQLVLPMAFLPTAERMQFSQHIDRWVIRNTVQYLADCADERVHTVNLSAGGLTDGALPGFILATLDEYGLPASRLGFEVSESIALSNMERASEFFAKLKAYGCRLAIDDFANGLNSFSYLRKLPVDFLKIDASLSRNVGADPINAYMLEAINKAAHGLGICTIAECIDSEALLRTVTGLDVDYAQGFHLAAPAPLVAHRR